MKFLSDYIQDDHTKLLEAMWVEDLPEPQEDFWDLDDDSDDFTDEIESATCLEDQMTLCLNNF